MEHQKIEKFLQRLPEVEILVFGDLMLDEYLWGKTERISPEAPVQVVDIIREDLRLGGAGNVINNLVALGCKVRILSILGNDADGLRLQSMLADKGLDTENIFLDRERKTSRKTRILASNQQMMRIDRESREEISGAMENRVLDRFSELLPQCRLVLVSDYNKGFLTDTLLAGMIRRSRDEKIPVFIDPKGQDFRKYRGATLLTPNRKEALRTARLDALNDANLRLVGRSLVRDLDLDALVLTRSEEGMTLFLRDEEIDLPTHAREVFDVSGAGDTVLSVLGAGVAAGLSLLESATVANIAAGIVVGKVGTSTVFPEEILGAANPRILGADGKIRPLDQLKKLVEDARQNSKTVVFTNGCFDLLHVGHVKYLQQARQCGDLLILGLNSDASVRRLKGEKRPLIQEHERAHVLAALSCVDFVTIFDEDTPRELISALRPDILVKGGDYLPEEVVGKDIVESYGGRVEIIPFVDGRSTTSLINRILEKY
jgi:D-beta-D-heptose 7-phosphate kinase/D-beta-D-heptose 1-phosphate adenosyltransferase